MSEPFVGEIRMFAGNFAPRGWGFCDGQLLAISQNDALFSLLGTIYGGDGRTTFGLPDMRGRIPIHAGTGPGLSPYSIGAKAGSENVTLTPTDLPQHSHDFHANTLPGEAQNPSGRVAATGVDTAAMYSNTAPDTPMSANMIASAGNSAQHNNLMPTLCVNFIIALFGIYPSRS